MSKKPNYFLWLFLFVVALLARLLFLKLYNENYFISPDGLTYSNMAENFLQGKGIINTIRDRDYVVGPIYPLFLVLVYFFFGVKNYAMVVICQAVISALTVVLAYQLGEILFGKKYGWISYLLFLFYPLFSFWTIYVLTETVYIFMLTLFLYVCVLYAQNLKQPRKRFRNALLIGIVLGLSNLLRPLLLLVLPVLLVWSWFINGWNLKKAFKDLVLICLMMMLVMSPWWIRNYLRYHQFIVATNYGAYELYAGNNPYTVTDEYFYFAMKTYDPVVKARIDKLPIQEQEKQYSQLAKSYILKHPWEFVQRTYSKEVNLFWNPIALWEATSNKIRGYRFDQWYLLLGLVGAVLSVWRLSKYSILLLMSLYYSVIVSMITVVDSGRYRVPIMPAVILLGALVFVDIIKGLNLIFRKIRIAYSGNK